MLSAAANHLTGAASGEGAACSRSSASGSQANARSGRNRWRRTQPSRLGSDHQDWASVAGGSPSRFPAAVTAGFERSLQDVLCRVVVDVERETSVLGWGAGQWNPRDPQGQSSAGLASSSNIRA